MVKYILLFVLVWAGWGCKENADGPQLAKITDLTGDEEVISGIVYDKRNRMVSYGNTPITYKGDKVTVGEMDGLQTGDRLCSVTFKMVKGRAKESKARCRLKVDGEECEAIKATVYEYGKDTLCIRSDYHALSDNRFLRHSCGKYIYDEEGTLKEVMMTYREANDSVSACHTYYNYDNHISYEANVNLQAYVIDRDGLDSFFYFLLNLGRHRNNMRLPNDIGYCMNHGLKTYNVHANYRLENESLMRIEVLYEYAKLLSRIDLMYNPSK